MKIKNGKTFLFQIFCLELPGEPKLDIIVKSQLYKYKNASLVKMFFACRKKYLKRIVNKLDEYKKKFHRIVF